jgi:dihydropteroate synthase
MLTLEYLAELVQEYQSDLPAKVAQFDLGGRFFAFGEKPAIMGVINLSRDSWYRESVCLEVNTAVQRGRVLAAQGADLVDLGAESTLAHAARVDDATQQHLLLPVIRGLCAEGILVSVETYSPVVARASLLAGARVLNLTGPAASEAVFRLAVEHDAAVIICYVQGANVREVGDFDFSEDPIGRMRDYFASQVELAQQLGLRRILIDPGLGFYYRNLQDSSRRIAYQMRTFLSTFRLRSLGFPVCHALPHAFEYFGDEVRTAEPFFALLASLGKTDLFRTHEVPRVRAVLRTLGSLEDPRH